MLVHEHGRLRGSDELVGRAVGEQVIGDHDDEQGIVDELALGGSEGGAVAVHPSIGEQGSHAMSGDALNQSLDGRRSCTHHHDHVLDADGEESPDRSFDQRDAAQVEVRLGAAGREGSHPLRPPGSQDDGPP